jgi:asparagine synthase (glutamine-hydrolysing)
MCGVFAAFCAGPPLDPARAYASLASLRHRGPDGEGVWRSPSGAVTLGHVRLAIVDPDSGHQPLLSEDGCVVAAVNGELYDEARLRRDLEARGHRFRSRSDSELLVHLYEEHDLACLEHLRGEFAFVLWDERRRRLFAARDRFGVKPLCWARLGGDLYLASEAKALFAAGVPAAWDHLSFLHAASHQYLPPDRTLFAGVSQLAPGNFLIAANGNVEIRRYWDLDLPTETDDDGAPAPGDAAADIRIRLDEAVRLRLRGDVPVACHLSGGVDSGLVAALAARHAPTPPPCFAIAFDEPAYDEQHLAAETARHIGSELHIVRVTQDALLEALPQAVVHGEGIAINGQLVAKYLLAGTIRDAGYKVVLSGEGADEVFLGYAHLRRDLFLAQARAGDPGGTARLARLEATNHVSAGVMLPVGAPPPLSAVRDALGVVPTFLEAKAATGRKILDLLRDDYLRSTSDVDPFAALMASVDVAGQLRGRHPVMQASYLWTRLALAGYILRTLGDGTEMAHSLEGRLPFVDDRVFAAARALPISLKIRGELEKHVLREAARPMLPEGTRFRPKHPLLAPPITRFPGARSAALIAELLGSAAFRAQPFFDPRRVRKLVDGLPLLDDRACRALEPIVMTALCTAVLQDRFRLAAGGSPA